MESRPPHRPIGSSFELLSSELRARLWRLAVLSFQVGGTLAIAALTLWGGVVGWEWLSSSQKLVVEEIRVEGVHRADAEELLARGNLQEGLNIFSVDLASAVLAIEEDSWVATATVSRQLPASIVVEIREHEAVALVQANGLYAVTREGLLFRRVLWEDKLDLPVISGLDGIAVQGESRANEPALQTALEVMQAWARLGLSERIELSELQIRREYGEAAFVLWTLDPAVEIHLGVLSPESLSQILEPAGASDLELRLTRIGQVFEETRRRGVSISRIDAGNQQRPELVAVRVK